MWMSRGWLDANCPMDYKAERHPRPAREFRNWLVGFKRWNGGRRVYVGINLSDNSAEDVLKQIEAVKKAGHEGFVIFSFNESGKREDLVQKLGGRS